MAPRLKGLTLSILPWIRGRGGQRFAVSSSLISNSCPCSSNCAPVFARFASSSQAPAGQKWDLYAAVVLERKPVITQEKTELEEEYSQLLAKYEFELSKKNNHEVRKQKDAKIVEKVKSGELDADAAASITAQDEEDLWTLEHSQFTPASRKTEADKSNNQKSLDRALDSHLMLLIEQKLGTEWKWVCPQGKWRDGETMRQTADRILKEFCPEVRAKVLGNAPWGFYKYKYPKRTVEGQGLEAVGAKVFFYKAQIQEGDVQREGKKEKDPLFKDYIWARREELPGKLHPEYFKQVSEFLIDERN